MVARIPHISQCIFSHGTFGFFAAYLSGGEEVIIADGYAEHLEERYEPVRAAMLMNWTRMWDPCFERGRAGVLTEECKREEEKYGISEPWTRQHEGPNVPLFD